jgi:hypothetical protein
MKAGTPDVRLYDGSKKGNQRAQHAVIDIDTGPQNLQQCADAVIRLRAEYLFAQKAYDQIHFRFTSGDDARYLAYAAGERASVTNNRVKWSKREQAAAPSNYKTFRAYLDLVFTYAGSASLDKALVPLADTSLIEPGDVIIQAGFPGHAVTVVDVCVSEQSAHRQFLIAQSYMPAQDIHVLKNPNDEPMSPWYSTDIIAKVVTPEWTFEKQHFKRFRSSP